MYQIQQDKGGNRADAADGNGDTGKKQDSSVEGEIALVAAHGIVKMEKGMALQPRILGMLQPGQDMSVNISYCDVFIFCPGSCHFGFALGKRQNCFLLKVEMFEDCRR
ncbi:hypothetical protein [Herbaspirillum rhizosphaerae]|uniref:hypothetical protein n=1 Tax=Herbaspirillum rhizosphaerae TaxID=346179 RepID=UPI00142F3B53|nr:hypothetical protein [Herbaspirillum rhizosphaerae]